MSKTNKGQAPSCRLAQKRNWSWCRLNNALGQIRAVVHDADNVMLASEKLELQAAIKVMEKFFDTNDNSTNWEKRKAVTAMLRCERKRSKLRSSNASSIVKVIIVST